MKRIPRVVRPTPIRATTLGIPELNVINWAIALTRAKTADRRKHAIKMLGFAVERLGDGR